MTENTRPAVESHDPKVPAAWSAFMRSGWGDRELDLPAHPITPYAAARRARLVDTFPGERLVIPAGGYKVRSYDTDYRFRADTAHTAEITMTTECSSGARVVVTQMRRNWPGMK